MLTEDLSVFFNADEFAVEANICGVVVKGIEGRMVSIANQVHCSKLTFTCAETCVPPVTVGDPVVMHQQTYQIIDAKPDGTGLLTLTLELAT